MSNIFIIYRLGKEITIYIIIHNIEYDQCSMQPKLPETEGTNWVGISYNMLKWYIIKNQFCSYEH